ncbi:MAG: hypothetical protein DUW69_000887 [Verrucomicrobia bacterium]|jgi:hypothetical protein|nr:MAG: hypothetical protein DUW69_000887 [Verrucomicrobiota bacterium]
METEFMIEPGEAVKSMGEIPVDRLSDAAGLSWRLNF